MPLHTRINPIEAQRIIIEIGSFYFFPRVITVRTGCFLNLWIKNTSNFEPRIFIPAFGIDKKIGKLKILKINILINLEVNKIIWFKIYHAQRDLNGYIIIEG